MRLLSSFGKTIISHFLCFVNMSSKILFNNLRLQIDKKSFTQESFFMFTYGLSILLISIAFMSINAKYGIPLLRYAVFSKTVI